MINSLLLDLSGNRSEVQLRHIRRRLTTIARLKINILKLDSVARQRILVASHFQVHLNLWEDTLGGGSRQEFLRKLSLHRIILRARVHYSVIILELFLWEMFLPISYRNQHFSFCPWYHVKGTIVSFILKDSMAGSWTDLAITQVAALASTYFRYSSYQFMNIRIILLIVKSIVACHLFDFYRLWWKWGLFNCLELGCGIKT